MINLASVFLVLVGSVLAALAAFLVKKGMDVFSFRVILHNKMLLGGVLLYGFSALIYIAALTGGELTLLFPLASTTYIWSNLLSVRYLKEKMNVWKWLSISGIIAGVLFIGIGS